MTALALVIELPEHWSEQTARILANRLVEKELPPGLRVALGVLSRDMETFTSVVKAWETA